MYGLPDFSLTDFSGRASTHVSDTRRFGPYGALIHSTDGTDSADWLLGGSDRAGSPASANYLINRDGGQIKLCPFERYPFHAGKSRFYYAGKWLRDSDVSQWFVGIELECTNEQSPTTAQYQSCAQRIYSLAVQLNWRWPYTILGHYAVATPLGRRSDPWLFDWGEFYGYLLQIVSMAGLAGLKGH